MSFAIYPQPDACRAWMPTNPMPPGTSVPAPPLVCHMPKGHGGQHSNERHPSTLSRRWEGDARPEPAPRPAGQDAGHRQTAAEVDYWETAMAELDSCGLMPSDAGTIGTIAAALAAADRDGYQRGREEMALQVRALADELAELPGLREREYVAHLLRALADRNDEEATR